MDDPRKLLAAELKTYREQKDDLLKNSEGKYVLIAGETILGVYSDKVEAVAIGHQQVGPGPFLVKKIERIDKPVFIFLTRG